MDLFKCAKRYKFHVPICTFNLPISVAIVFVNWACHSEYRVHWRAKSQQGKSMVKIGT